MTVDQASEALNEALKNSMYGDTANDNKADEKVTFSLAERDRSVLESIESTVHRANDNIVCSFIAMYRYGNVSGGNASGGHMPWTVEAETIRALIDVLDRAGYSATGRRHIVKNPAEDMKEWQVFKSFSLAT